MNLGARLESLCKQYSAEIIISEFTHDALRGSFPEQLLGAVVVKGKSQPVKIYRIFYETGARSLPPLQTEGVRKFETK